MPGTNELYINEPDLYVAYSKFFTRMSMKKEI